MPSCELIILEKALLRPKAPPPEPVREICGKNWALATPISAFAATRTCSAWRISGRRSRSDEGRPGGTSGGSHCSTRRPARHSVRVIAKENADGIFLLRDLALQVGDRGIRRIKSLLCLQNVELGGHTVLEAEVGEFHRIFLSGDSFVGDLQLKVEFQQREIVA